MIKAPPKLSVVEARALLAAIERYGFTDDELPPAVRALRRASLLPDQEEFLAAVRRYNLAVDTPTIH